MSLLNLLGIGVANAAPATNAQQPGAGSMFSMLLMFLVIIAFAYFAMIRPQNRRRKEQQKLMGELTIGDEVVTIGGILGRVSRLKDDFVEITVSKDTVITMQKSSISNVLPKGTIEA